MEGEETGWYRVSPGYISNVVDVEINGDEARVDDCSLDQGVLYDAEGGVVIPGDEEYKMRQAFLLHTTEGWLVADWVITDDVCVPEG